MTLQFFFRASRFVLALLFICGFFSCNSLLSLTNTPAPNSITSFEAFKIIDATEKDPAISTQDASCQTDSCKKQRQEFRYVVYVAGQIYCYWDEKKADTQTDFTKLALDLEKTIVDGFTVTQYFKVLQVWAASFHDGHVNVMPSDLSVLEIYSTPIKLELFGAGTDHEKVIVIQNKGIAGVSVGDEILEINGNPTQTALDDAEKRTSGSTRGMRRWSAARKLLDALGAEVGDQALSIKVKGTKGIFEKTLYRTIDITAAPVLKLKEDDEEKIKPEDLIKKIPSVKILPGSYGYLRIDGFIGDSQLKAVFDQALDRMKFTKGLILDLRRNGGGDLSGDELLSRFTNEAITRYYRSERLNDFILSARPENFSLTAAFGAPFADWHALTVNPSKPDWHYANPVVALISPYCFSACDTFSAALKDYKLATMVGEATGGGTGTPLVFALPNSGFMFRYSVIRGKTPKGEAIEGIGTTPDFLKEPEIEDRINENNDSQVDYALAILKAKSSFQEANPSATLINSFYTRESIPGLRDTEYNSAPSGMSATKYDLLQINSISKRDEL